MSAGGRAYTYAGGVASGMILSSGGTAFIANGGTDKVASVLAGGSSIVCKGGVASATTIESMGKLINSSGGIVRGVTVKGGGIYHAVSGAVTSGLTLYNNGSARIANGTWLSQSAVVNGGVIQGTAGSDAIMAHIGKGATFKAVANANLSKVNLYVQSGTLLVTGLNNKAASVSTISASTITFDLRSVKASSTSYMLTMATAKTLWGKGTISVGAAQGIGVYELASGFAMSNGKAISISMDGVVLGDALVSKSSLQKNDLKYWVQNSSARKLTLTVTAIAGKMVKGSSSSETLTGGVSCDVIYGGAGNDTIWAGDGRDIAVYDTKNWGTDTIKRISGGTMSILFNGISSNQVTTSLSGTTMTITRKDGSGDSIKIEGWNASTHNIVYGGTLSAFNTYVNAASPTNAQADAARSEVWQKTGLLAG